MNKSAILITALGLCVFFARFTAAQPPKDVNDPQGPGVTMALTRLDVNDTELELSYKIKNDTDHNVWICDNVDVYTTLDFEVYLDEDEQSLLIRRRLDVPTAWQWISCPYGRYVLLRSGQERNESLSLAVPVQPRRLFASELETSDHAGRLVLEIGFYNEDLPKTIRDILEMAEKLNCTRLEHSESSTAFFIRYFEGIWIAHWLFGGLSNFEKYTYQEGNEEIKIPYTWQKFSGEQVLRIEVDGVHIPYEESPYPSSGGQVPIPPKGRACFLAETPVWIDGMIVPIAKVVAGQAVRRSLCTTAGLWPDRVETVQEHTGTFECRDIVLESGNHIGVVGAHCFMLATGEWIAAQDLKSGLSLRTLQGTVRIKSVTVRARPYTGKAYNLKIKNSDEYIVGTDAVIVRDY
ncbi:MAG: Hint domain-containing protein [Planctomycetota bacterium]